MWTCGGKGGGRSGPDVGRRAARQAADGGPRAWKLAVSICGLRRVSCRAKSDAACTDRAGDGPAGGGGGRPIAATIGQAMEQQGGSPQPASSGASLCPAPSPAHQDVASAVTAAPKRVPTDTPISSSWKTSRYATLSAGRYLRVLSLLFTSDPQRAPDDAPPEGMICTSAAVLSVVRGSVDGG